MKLHHFYLITVQHYKEQRLDEAIQDFTDSEINIVYTFGDINIPVSMMRFNFQVISNIEQLCH